MLVGINNCKGSVTLGIVVAIVAVFSGVSLSSVAFNDSHRFEQQLDAVQQFHFLRSEVGRGRFLVNYFESKSNSPLQSSLPIRLMVIEFDKHRKVYQAKTKLDLHRLEYDSGYSIRSLISTVPNKESTSGAELHSSVKRYGENQVRYPPTIAIFHYFSDIDEERDGVAGNIRFCNGEVIYGRVHSNTDIWIGGPPWPTFHGLVTTAGDIKHIGGQYNRDEVFRGGLIENYHRVVFEPSAQLVRSNGSTPLGTKSSDNRIAYITIDGSTFNTMIGEVVEENHPVHWIEGVNRFTIYNSYPPYGPVGDSIGVNRILRKDTVWTVGPSGSLRNASAFIPMKTWISGNVGGRQTWASSHDIWLKGDITYDSTIPGQRPDGIDDNGNLTRHVNRSDYFGLISEGSIWIQYGHKDPRDSVRYKLNTESIYLYGAYCAVGQGDNAWDDGIFSFEYQFPKGSTPPQYWYSEKFKNIDLHRFRYPTSMVNPWPVGLDYPWYNPLWPEPGEIYGFPGFPVTPNPHNAQTIVKLRGNIWLYGSIAQRRRGYVRRSGGIDFDTGIWDVDNMLNPFTPPRYGSPSPDIGPIGYDKKYHGDTRFEGVGPPDYPLVRFEGNGLEEHMDSGYTTKSWIFKKPPVNF